MRSERSFEQRQDIADEEKQKEAKEKYTREKTVRRKKRRITEFTSDPDKPVKQVRAKSIPLEISDFSCVNLTITTMF